jgi:carboxypeptidase Taq
MYNAAMERKPAPLNTLNLLANPLFQTQEAALAYGQLKTIFAQWRQHYWDAEIALVEGETEADPTRRGEIGNRRAEILEKQNVLLNQTDDQGRPLIGQLLALIKKDPAYNEKRSFEDLPNFTADNIKGFHIWDKANIREMERAYLLGSRATREKEIRELEEAVAASADFPAREDEDPDIAFRRQKEITGRVIRAQQAAIAPVAAELGVSVYDVLLETNNAYTTYNKDVAPVLEGVERHFPALITEARNNLLAYSDPLPLPAAGESETYELMEKLKNRILAAAGWSEERLARENISIKAAIVQGGFTGGSDKDLRVGFEYYPDDLMKSISVGIHEIGHLLYYVSLNEIDPTFRSQPAGIDNGVGIHEICAKVFELSARTRQFYDLIGEDIREHFSSKGYDVSGPEWQNDNLHRHALKASLSTVEDMRWWESEYVMAPNIYWRVVAEEKLLNGEMDLDEIPEFWAVTMTKLTGIEHKTEDFIFYDSLASGGAGYSWAYLKSSMDGASLHEKMSQDISLDSARSADDYFSRMTKWMQEKIYSKGGLLPQVRLVESILGKTPGMDDYAAFLRRSFTGPTNNGPDPSHLQPG